jgi:hypothetical protein
MHCALPAIYIGPHLLLANTPGGVLPPPPRGAEERIGRPRRLPGQYYSAQGVYKRMEGPSRRNMDILVRDHHCVSTFTDYLTHALQGFLLVGTQAENSFKIAVIKYISIYIFICIYIIFIIKILVYYRQWASKF